MGNLHCLAYVQELDITSDRVLNLDNRQCLKHWSNLLKQSIVIPLGQ